MNSLCFRCCGVALGLVGTPLFMYAQSARPSKVYVAEFSSRNISSKEVLESFSDLFETALQGKERFKILNRRTFYRVLAEAQNEGTLASMQDVSQRARNNLARTQTADGVIFGVVTDDQTSGQIRISASLQSFDAEIHCQSAVTMTRGRLNDLASREEVMNELAAQLCQGARPTGGNAGVRQPNASRAPAGGSQLPSDADPTARLSYIEGILKSRNAKTLQSALRMAFKSEDQSWRSLAVRAYIASVKELSLDLQLPPEIQRQFDNVQTEAERTQTLINKYPYIDFLMKHAFRMRFSFGDYDISNSRGIISVSSLGSNSTGTFALSGDRVTGTVRGTVLRFGKAPTVFASDINYATVECTFDIRPVSLPASEDPTWKGVLSCQNWGTPIPRIAVAGQIF